MTSQHATKTINTYDRTKCWTKSLAGIFNLAETMVGIPSLQRNAYFIERSSTHGSLY
jgi:hypothetical protein